MLETVREYALERLAEHKDAEDMRRRHAQYYLALAEEADPKLRGPEHAQWHARLEAEHDNLLAALRWSLDGGDPEFGRQLTLVLWYYWARYGHFSEGGRWLQLVLDPHAAPTPRHQRAYIVARAGDLAWRQGKLAQAQTLFEESLALCRELGDTWGTAFALLGLAHVADHGNDLDVASGQELYAQSLALFRQTGDTFWIASVLCDLGGMIHDLHDLRRATALYEESLALFQALQFMPQMPAVLCGLARAATVRGDLKRAEAWLEESLKVARELGDTDAWALLNLGQVVFAQGDLPRARSLLEQSYALYRQWAGQGAEKSSGEALLPLPLPSDVHDLNAYWGIGKSTSELARLLIVAGEAQLAAELLEQGLPYYQQAGDCWGIGRLLCSLGCAVRAQGDDARATMLLKQSLAYFRQVEYTTSRTEMVECIEALAGISGGCSAEEPEVRRDAALRAARLFGAADAIRKALDAPLPPVACLAYERDIAVARAHLADADFAAAWAEGQAMPLQQVIAYSLD
jgi:tetratricopeptide (TPR) repeat protein